MELEYPYQLTTFLDTEPQLDEPVYSGPNGWYPQLALKRRFTLRGIDEVTFFEKLSDFCTHYGDFVITTHGVVKPEQMPVKIIEVEPSEKLMNFHLGFIAMMGNTMESRYPERDGENYLPHITAEFNGAMVIDTTEFTDRQFKIGNVWLLKDIEDENSRAYRSFKLG